MTMRRLFRGLLLAPLVCLAIAHAPSPSGDLRSAQTARIEAAARTFMEKTGITNMSFLLMRGETVRRSLDFTALVNCKITTFKFLV